MKIHQKVTSMKKNHRWLTANLTKSADDGAVKGGVIGSLAGATVAGDKVYQGLKAIHKRDVARGGITAKSKLMLLSKKSLKKSIPGIVAATAVGAGVGALAKSASVPAVIPRQVVGKLVREPLSGKAKLALLAGGALATSLAAKKIGDKTGREYTPVSSTVRGAAKGALVGGTLAGVHGVGRAIGAAKVISQGKGLPLGGALNLSAGALKMTGKGMKAGATVGLLVGLAKGLIGHKKEAETVVHEGQTYKKGTVGSATKKMAIGAGAIGALGGMAIMRHPAGALLGAGGAAIQGGLAGLTYGAIRGSVRGQGGDRSLSGRDFSEMKAKALQKKAAEAIVRGGQTYRRGTVGSAATRLAGIYGGIEGAAQLAINRRNPMKSLKVTGVATSKGVAIGGLYGLIRGSLRESRGEKSLNHKDFKEMKNVR